MADGAQVETRIANIPGYGRITVNNVPTGMSDDDFRTQFRQRHPEYFGSATSGQAAAPQTTQPSVSSDTSQRASFLSRLLSPENIARSSEPPPNAPWYSPERWAYAPAVRAVGGLVNMLRPATTPEEEGVQSSGGYPALLGERMFGSKSPSASELSKAQEAANRIPTKFDPLHPFRGSADAASALGHTMGAIPLIGTGIAGIAERFPKDPSGAVGDIGAAFSLARGGTEVGNVVKQLGPGLTDIAERGLSKGMIDVKQTAGHGGDVYIKAQDRFLNLRSGIAAEHGATGKTYSIFELQKDLRKFADQYNTGTTTPKFNAIYKEVANSHPELTWDELSKLRTRIGYIGKAAGEESKDAGAAGSAYAKITNMLKQGAEEVGRADEFDKMNRIWSGLRHYQGDGILGRMMHMGTDPAAPGGIAEGAKEFFDVLRDKSNSAKLNEINKAFSEYGMPDNYFRDMAKKYEPYRSYVESQQPIKGFRGALSSIIRSPMYGGAGALAGHAVGGWPGAVAGGVVGLRTGAALRLANALANAGGREAFPPINPLAGTNVPSRALSPAAEEYIKSKEATPSASPTGGKTPTADPISSAQARGINVDDVKSAVANLGVKGQAAIAAKVEEILRLNPKTTSEAIDMAAGKKSEIKPVPGDSQAITEPIHKDLLRTVLELGGGKISERVRLSDLRPRMEKLGYDRASVDKAIKTLQVDPYNMLSVIPIDLPSDISNEDRAAALDIAGKPRHAVILRENLK